MFCKSRLVFKVSSNLTLCQICQRKLPNVASARYLSETISDSQPESQAWFGYESVADSEEKQGRVNEVFSSVAQNYDLMNDVMSLGVHRYWKDEFVRQCNVHRGMNVLDMAGGTGDIAFRIRRSCPECCITVGDINEDMLHVGRTREGRQSQNGAATSEISWTVADGQVLPFDDNSFDLYCVAFGIRNYGHLQKGLEEAHRVLKQGGRFMCLEFSHVENSLVRNLYDRYSMEMIPVLGALIASDWDSYKYLVESIRKFPSKHDFSHMISKAGFCGISCNSFLSGVAAIHSAFKLS